MSSPPDGDGSPKRRRIAFLSGAPRVSTKATAQAGGARQHVLGTIEGFQANGCDVEAYIVGNKVPAGWLAGAKERDLESSLIKRIAADLIRIALAVFHTLGALWVIRDADWVYERCGAFQMFGYFFQRRSIPWVLETNYLMFEELFQDRRSVAIGGLLRWIELFAYRNCDILVAVSQELKNAIITKCHIPAEKIIVVPNAADTKVFDPSKTVSKRLFDAETFVVGFQGSMYAWAGLEQLLHAIAFLRKSHRNVAAVLVGDGHERVALEALARSLDISPYVKFVGFVPRAQVPEYIAGFDLCFSGQKKLQSNAMYLSPLKLYDYMAMAKPVIASRFDDAIALTRGGAIGYLYESEDVSDLQAKLMKAYDDRPKLHELGLASFEQIEKYHTWKIRIRDFLRRAESILDSADVSIKTPFVDRSKY